MDKYVPVTVDEDNRLLCPKCGEYYLHLVQTEVFECVEGSEECAHVTVSLPAKVTVDQDMKGNPSSWRDGVKLYFSCEDCHVQSGEVDGDPLEESLPPEDNFSSPVGKHVLVIEQHKGCTYVRWEAPV